MTHKTICLVIKYIFAPNVFHINGKNIIYYDSHICTYLHRVKRICSIRSIQDKDQGQFPK